MGFGIALKTLESAYIRKLHLYSHPAEKFRKIVNYTSVNRMKNWKYVCEKSTNHPTGLFTIWEKFGSCIFHRVCVGECPWPYMMLRDYPPEIPPQLPVPPTWYQPYNTYALHRVRNSRECIFLLQFYSEYTTKRHQQFWPKYCANSIALALFRCEFSAMQLWAELHVDNF